MAMYVIAGKHKGRRIESPEGRDIRPTASRTREAVFNILAHGRYGERGLLKGRMADVFCGSGAMGLEALSRGAASITFVDKSSDALKAAEHNLKYFGETAHAKLIRADSSQLPTAPHPHEILFVDPPYNGLGIKSLLTALRGGWLAPQGVAVLEQSWKEPVVIPEGYLLESERKYGNTRVLLLGLE
jgi:16S rRNA (guanine966-N2)-methyltransferase